jgi:ArsR family transcriptional regulator
MHIFTRPDIELIFAALAHQARLEIVAMLGTGEKCACVIAELLKRERTVVSRHLKLLEQAGIIQSRTEGRMVIYRLRDRRALALIDIGLDMVKHPVKEKEGVMR